MPRRAFVRASLVGGAGLAVGCGRPPVDARAVEGAEVVVVGAGIAGLVCTHQLAAAGVRATLYEAQSRVGGRVFSGRGIFADDLVCELGAELVNGNHLRMRGLCRELGLELDDYCEDYADTTEVFHIGGVRYSAAQAEAAFEPLARAMREAHARVGGFDVSYREPGLAAELDRQSIKEWLDRVELEPWFRTLIEVAFTTELGLDCEEQSALNMLYLYQENAAEGAFSAVGMSDERFHVRGGNDLVATGLAERLSGAIELGARLVAVRGEAGRYVLSFERDGGRFDVRAAHVVLALPFTTLREVELAIELPEPKRRAIRELGYGTNTKLMIGHGARVWREHGSNGSVISDLPFQTAWEGSRLQDGASGFLVAFTGGRVGAGLSPDRASAEATRFTEALDRIFPGLAAARTNEVAFHWPGFAWSKGSYACHRPGQWAAFGGAEAEVVGTLSFAGEHTSDEFQGFMEGAAESGERAAAEVLARLGRPAAPPLGADPVAPCEAPESHALEAAAT